MKKFWYTFEGIGNFFFSRNRALLFIKMSGGIVSRNFAAVLTILFERNVHRNWPCREPCINKTCCNYMMHSFCMQRDNNENLLHSFCRTGPVHRQRVKVPGGGFIQTATTAMHFRATATHLSRSSSFSDRRNFQTVLKYVSPFIFDSLLLLRFHDSQATRLRSARASLARKPADIGHKTPRRSA